MKKGKIDLVVTDSKYQGQGLANTSLNIAKLLYLNPNNNNNNKIKLYDHSRSINSLDPRSENKTGIYEKHGFEKVPNSQENEMELTRSKFYSKNNYNSEINKYNYENTLRILKEAKIIGKRENPNFVLRDFLSSMVYNSNRKGNCCFYY